MNPPRRLASIVVLAVVGSACSGSVGGPGSSFVATASTPSAGGTRTSEAGQVTVIATWNGPAAGTTFDIKLDTHAVDLDALDLSNAILRNDRGETLAAQPWAAAKGGHHRGGALTFDGDASRFLAGAKWIELVLTGIGDVPERTLRWAIGS